MTCSTLQENAVDPAATLSCAAESRTSDSSSRTLVGDFVGATETTKARPDQLMAIIWRVVEHRAVFAGRVHSCIRDSTRVFRWSSSATLNSAKPVRICVVDWHDERTDLGHGNLVSLVDLSLTRLLRVGRVVTSIGSALGVARFCTFSRGSLGFDSEPSP